MTLKSARAGRTYTIQKINIDEHEPRRFLLTLGLYGGEKIRIISRLRGGYIVAIKNARYFIDARLAAAIII